MIELKDLAYVRSGTEDLATQVRFARDIVGLEVVAIEDGTAYLRADERHHCVAFVEGAQGALSHGFTLADPGALEAAESELEAAGIKVSRGDDAEARQRRVRHFISFDDPGGNTIDLAVGQIKLESRPVRFGRAAGITEFGHIGVEAPDVMEMQRFWSRHFNMKVSDWIGDTACLMRFDPVHHKFAVFRDDTGLAHINFQVASIDDIMRSWHFLEDNGVEIEMGPGRHPQSTAVFLYFKGPEGITWEYSSGVRLIPDDMDWQPRYFDPAEPDFIDMWRGKTQTPNVQV
jgi:2,3-dihydroxy-p-cumate/2,3-dihydroxybenzoate 3,4-dioxygenase